MKTIFLIAGKKFILKYQRKMPEKEVTKMKSFITNKGQKLVKTKNFKIIKIQDSEKERLYKIDL